MMGLGTWPTFRHRWNKFCDGTPSTLQTLQTLRGNPAQQRKVLLGVSMRSVRKLCMVAAVAEQKAGSDIHVREVHKTKKGMAG
jgi:hypothetical protein